MVKREFRDQQTAYQVERFKAAPNAEKAQMLIEVTMQRLSVGKISFATASSVLRLVAEFFDECEVIVSRRSITRS